MIHIENRKGVFAQEGIVERTNFKAPLFPINPVSQRFDSRPMRSRIDCFFRPDDRKANGVRSPDRNVELKTETESALKTEGVTDIWTDMGRLESRDFAAVDLDRDHRGPVIADRPAAEGALLANVEMAASEHKRQSPVMALLSNHFSLAIVFLRRSASSVKVADSDDVARLFRDHVARCSDMMSPA